MMKVQLFFKSHIIERYKIRPTSKAAVNDLCLAEFAAYYYTEYKKKAVVMKQVMLNQKRLLMIQLKFNTALQ